jgi:exonuclease VII small subunit
MSEELIAAIERMNNIERDFLNKWHRGNEIPEDLLERLKQAREKVKQLQTINQ